MPKLPLRTKVLCAYLLYAVMRDTFNPDDDLDDRIRHSNVDIASLLLILQLRYIAPRIPVPKAGSLHLAFEFADIRYEEHRFVQMLRVTPDAFRHLVAHIQDHPIFVSHCPKPQAPVELQLAVTLYRAGRYGNGASVADVATIAGIAEGSVVKYTERCMEALLSLDVVHSRAPTQDQPKTGPCRSM